MVLLLILIGMSLGSMYFALRRMFAKQAARFDDFSQRFQADRPHMEEALRALVASNDELARELHLATEREIVRRRQTNRRVIEGHPLYGLRVGLT